LLDQLRRSLATCLSIVVVHLLFLYTVPLSKIAKSLIPKSIPTLLFALGNSLIVSSTNNDTKYLPLGLLMIVALSILPFTSLLLANLTHFSFGILTLLPSI